ncbi:MAG: shikimate dehydrogenase [Clostridia bacterium]|nr:shikimate dehydrogenase [Clostridia bacterium]
MEYGCIGEKLGHSFSKEIHNSLADYAYELREVKKEELGDFMTEHDFKAINVTIPYKEAVIPYLHQTDDAARAIGAVNTVVNKGGKLYGYNTDFYGMSELIRHAGIDLHGKKVAILGSGGTSKTARAVSAHLGATEIIRVSRTASDKAVSYEELYEKHADTEIIINTTPLGMYPDVFGCAVDIDRFPRLSGVIDAVYNPLRTELISNAKERGIKAEGGLYMLVAQGVRASEIFTDTKYDASECERVFKKIEGQKENVVLTGMPASGKSTVGAILAKRLGVPFIDTDALIEKKIGMSIPEYFLKFGEAAFRDREEEVIADVSSLTSSVIATGGGAVLRRRNVHNLKKNGKLFFIDRPLSELIPTADRPLAKNREAIEKRYAERYGIYCATADVRIPAECAAEEVAERIVVKR